MQAEDDDKGGRHPRQSGDGRLSLTLVNDLGEIPRLGAAVERFGAEHGLPIEVIDGINIALDELVTNVIRYGHDDGARHHIRVDLSVDAGCLAIEVIDDGRAFNPFDRPPPDLGAPLEERPVGGLGIHFVRTLMDAVDYRRDENRNRVRMTKNL